MFRIYTSQSVIPIFIIRIKQNSSKGDELSASKPNTMPELQFVFQEVFPGSCDLVFVILDPVCVCVYVVCFFPASQTWPRGKQRSKRHKNQSFQTTSTRSQNEPKPKRRLLNLCLHGGLGWWFGSLGIHEFIKLETDNIYHSLYQKKSNLNIIVLQFYIKQHMLKEKTLADPAWVYGLNLKQRNPKKCTSVQKHKEWSKYKTLLYQM